MDAHFCNIHTLRHTLWQLWAAVAKKKINKKIKAYKKFKIARWSQEEEQEEVKEKVVAKLSLCGYECVCISVCLQ